MNKQAILEYVGTKFPKKDHKAFRVGDTVRVHVKITEGDSTRIQAFEGIVISLKGSGATETFTVRKISFGVGVERCFPVKSPAIDRIDVVRSGYARRAKLYYLRDRIGRSARLEEKDAADTAKKSADGKSPAEASAQPELVAVEKK